VGMEIGIGLHLLKAIKVELTNKAGKFRVVEVHWKDSLKR
jgi:hypothetical protein